MMLTDTSDTHFLYTPVILSEDEILFTCTTIPEKSFTIQVPWAQNTVTRSTEKSYVGKSLIEIIFRFIVKLLREDSEININTSISRKPIQNKYSIRIRDNWLTVEYREYFGEIIVHERLEK